MLLCLENIVLQSLHILYMFVLHAEIITNFVMLFHAMMEFCLDLLRSKFWLIGDWSILFIICGSLGSI